jgi:hypothetical protein
MNTKLDAFVTDAPARSALSEFSPVNFFSSSLTRWRAMACRASVSAAREVARVRDGVSVSEALKNAWMPR